MKSIKILSLLLALLFAVSLFAACAGKNPGGETGSTTAASAPDSTPAPVETDPVDENGYLLDDLPVLNYGSTDFNLFTWSNQTIWEWSQDEVTTGDLIKDAIVKRQIAVEDRMGIKLVVSSQNGDWDHRNSFIDTVYNSTQSGGTEAFDLIGQYTPAAAIGAMRGCYTNLAEVKYLDLKKPWWPEDIYTSSSINGKVYSVAGDISPTLIRNMVCLLTNLSLAKDLNMPNFYELVENQAWTAETFLTYGTGTVSGLNASGGTAHTTTMPNNVVYDNLFYAGGFRFVERNDEKGLILSEDLKSSKIADWFDLWLDFWNKEDTAVIAINAAGGFTSGEVLFHFGSIADVQNYLQDITFDFGILPYPKFDENQDDYVTICGYWVSLYSIPVNAPDFDKSGAVLECLGSYGYRYVTPVVYNVAFEYRYLNSPENSKIFNLLHDTLVFEPGRTFCDQINCFAGFRQAAGQSESWAKYYQSNSRIWDKNIQAIVKQLG